MRASRLVRLEYIYQWADRLLAKLGTKENPILKEYEDEFYALEMAIAQEKMIRSPSLEIPPAGSPRCPPKTTS